MKFLNTSKFFLVALGAFVLQACSSVNNQSSSASALSCSTTASVIAGNISAAGAAVTLSGLNVAIYNGSGSYTLQLPDGLSGTVQGTSYTYPNTFQLTTGATGGVTSQVTVRDNSTGSTASCSLIISSSSTGTGTTGTLSLSASPAASVAVGGTIVLIANGNGFTSPVYTFTQLSGSTVTISNLGNGVASITSAIATTATISVTATVNGTAAASSQIAITFSGTGTSTGTATASLVASASSVAVGSTVTLTGSVTGIADPVYSFYYVSNTIGASGSFTGPVANFTATTAGSVTIGMQVYSNANSAIQATAQATVTFTGTGTGSTGSLVCSLSHPVGTYYRGMSIPFYITTNTGEALQLVYWDPGEGWDYGAPSLPMNLPMSGTYGYFNASYTYSGQKNVRILVQSATRPGVYCNGGAYLTDSLFVY